MAALYDVAIVGGGILGLSTALKITAAHPSLRLLLLEKEPELARHQTGNNSGVIHSGLYYRPGSLKARTCVAGRRELIAFCDENSVPYEICGKVVVATGPEELPRLEELHRRGVANGLKGLEIIAPERLRELEPHATGIKGLFVPETGIVDYKKVAAAYAGKIRDAGGDIRLSQRVVGLLERADEVILQTTGGDYRCKYMINCGGLQSDLIARMAWICEQEGIEADNEALAVLAAAGEGSVRDSLSALDQAIACCGAKLSATEVRALLGAFSLESLEKVTRALATGDSAAMLEVVDELERNGQNLQHFSRELSRYFRNLLVARIAGAVARGLSNKEIASEFRISFRTVEHHIRNILAKKNFSNRVEIAIFVKDLSKH